MKIWENYSFGWSTGCSVGSSNDWPKRWEGSQVNEIVKTLILAVAGGAGIVGLVFYYIRKWIDKRLTAREQEEQRTAESRRKRIKLEHQWRHAVGRFNFWAYTAIVKGEHNGELEAAMKDINDVEQKMKDLDYDILADNE